MPPAGRPRLPPEKKRQTLNVLVTPESLESFRLLAALAKEREGLSQGELVERWITAAMAKRRPRRPKA